jgi:virginiamycin B lyase
MMVLPLLAALLIFLALTTTVPNVVGQADTVALANIQKVGLKPTRLEEKSDKVPAGQVIRTDPGPGSLRRNHTGVTFFVSVGPEPVSVPSLANLDAATAKLQLDQAHLVEQAVNEANDTTAAGKVIGTDPAANTLVSRGSTVTVHVSLGSSPVVVPAVAGSTQAAAAAKLRAVGFQVAALQEPSASVKAGSVIRTDPPGGEQAAKASPVNMFVSSGPPAPGAGGGGGPAPGGAPAPGVVPVPGGGGPAPGVVPTSSPVIPSLALAKITPFPVATAAIMQGITTGSDGNAWFINGDNIDRMTPQGVDTHFPLVAPLTGARDITGGPDGNLWFTATRGIGRITTAGVIKVFPVSTVTNTAITVGPDSNLWFLAPQNNQIGRMSTTGALKLFPGQANMRGITSGPDGKVWFTWADATRDHVGRIGTDGTPADFSPPASPPGGASDITLGNDGNLWFTQPNSNGVARINLAGGVSNVPAPTQGAGADSIVSGPDGNLWFTETKAGNIARVTTSGTVTEFKVNTPGSAPTAITVGPDNTLWFIDNGSHGLGRVTFS